MTYPFPAPYAEAYWRLPVRLNRRDMDTLEREANARGYVLGYYLDVILAEKAIQLRETMGEMSHPSEVLAVNDPWRGVKPR